MTLTQTRSLLVVALLGIGSLGVVACSDEDGDGGVTDEEIQDGKDTATTVGDELQEERDAQDVGSNEG